MKIIWNFGAIIWQILWVSFFDAGSVALVLKQFIQVSFSI